jgi:hypothetical protein
MFPLELTDLICKKIDCRKLVKICIGKPPIDNFLYILNKNRIKKYWYITCIFKLVKYGDIHGVKYWFNINENLIQDKLVSSLACEHGRLKIIKYIEKMGVNIITDDNIITACQHGQLKTVKYLRKKGANIRARDDIPLEYACAFGHLNVVDYLVQKGVEICDKALEWACTGGHLPVVRYLVLYGAEITVQAMAIAKKYNYTEIIQYFMEYSYRD